MPKFREVLDRWATFELDDAIYVQDADIAGLDAEVQIVPFDGVATQPGEGWRYVLGIEQVRDVIEGLTEQLGRSPTPSERLKAVLHYAKHDAFIDLRDL